MSSLAKGTPRPRRMMESIASYTVMYLSGKSATSMPSLTLWPSGYDRCTMRRHLSDRFLGMAPGVSVQKVLGEDGHTLRGEVRREGHADARCGPWHPGMLHTCALEQPDSRGHRLWFQLRHTGLPWWLGALAYVGGGDRAHSGASWGGPGLAG